MNTKKINIAIVRGDFINPWELQNYTGLSNKYAIKIITGKKPIAPIGNDTPYDISCLLSPCDLNFGNINKRNMALLNRVFVDAHLLFGLKKIIKGYDIAHCCETYYGYTLQCLEAKKNKSIKAVISTVWENIPFNNESILGKSYIKQRALKEVDLFLAVTEKAKEALIAEGCKENKIEVLKPGVDQELFHPIYITSYRNINKNNKIKLLFVGRLEKEKGVFELLRLFLKTNEFSQKAELIIVGDGSQKKIIQHFIESNRVRNIMLIGNIPYSDMPKIYSLCDILIHPAFGQSTWTEQYGMVLVEAMSCGLPIISVDSGSIVEVLKGTGIILKEGDSLEIEVANLINNSLKREEMKIRNIAVANSNYNKKLFLKKIEQIYDKVIEKAK